MKYILLIMVTVLFTGCNTDSKEYTEFVKANGSDRRYYCDKSTGFLMKEYHIYNHTKYPVRYIVKNDLKQPIRCAIDVSVNVLETSQGTSR